MDTSLENLLGLVFFIIEIFDLLPIWETNFQHI